MRKLEPNPFCETLPFQPRFWNNSWLQTGLHCSRHFYYSAIRGLRPGSPTGPEIPGSPAGSVHLIFGSLIHEGADVYSQLTVKGVDPEDATAAALGHVLEKSWPEGQERDVFGGHYRNVFQCDDRTKTNTRKGIVRCSLSKAEHLVNSSNDFLDECPECRGPVTQRLAYLCDEKVKNRRTLARAMVALCDALTASPAKPYLLPDGRVSSEVRWFKELPLQSPDGTNYVMTGSFDRQDAQDSIRYIREYKTTKREPNDKYFDSMVGSPQVLTYTWAAGDARALLTVIHLGVGFAEVYVKPVYLAPGALAEWQGEMAHYIQEFEVRARLAQGHEAAGRDPALAYPRRLSACASLPGASTTPCPFTGICHLAPEDREGFLASNFVVDGEYSPLQVRGTAPEEE